MNHDHLIGDTDLLVVLHDWSDEDGAHILAQLRDVLDPAVSHHPAFSPSLLRISTHFMLGWADQSSILIIDTIIESGTVASSGPSLQDSLSKMSNEIYAPCPPPPFVPADYGDANRVTHGVNVILTAMCNCAFPRHLAAHGRDATRGVLNTCPTSV